MTLRLPLRVPVLALAAAVLLAGGCTPGGSPASQSRNVNVIRTAEVEGSTATNAYDLIHQLRPAWLRGRGSPDLRGSPPDLPVVYIGTTRQGPLETLRGIPSNGILELRFINAVTATTRYGNGHGGGVIEVILRRR